MSIKPSLNINNEGFVVGPLGEYRRLGAPIPEAAAGERVDGYLARNFPFLSRSGWQKRIDSVELIVNGGATKAAAKLKLGDQLCLFAPPSVEPDVDRGIRVLWEQSGVMAVFKPGNLPMHENGPYRRNTFAVIVAEELGAEWSAVHRLDRETSGIVICGATAELRGKIAMDLEARRVKKEYMAIARGVPAEREWHVDGPIGDLTGSRIRIKKWVVANGLPAQTGFTCLDVASDACLLHARPVTGRTNQIRIHAAYSGHVLYGDKLFHPDEDVFIEYFEQGQTESVVARTGFPRCCLHAYAMEFTHPGTKARVRVECPLPPDMQAFWDELKDKEAAACTLDAPTS